MSANVGKNTIMSADESFYPTNDKTRYHVEFLCTSRGMLWPRSLPMTVLLVHVPGGTRDQPRASGCLCSETKRKYLEALKLLRIMQTGHFLELAKRKPDPVSMKGRCVGLLAARQEDP